MKKNVIIAAALALSVMVIPFAAHVAGNTQELYAENIGINTTVSSLDGLKVMHGDEELSGDDYIATKDIIIKDGNEYIAVVMGDVTGDGKINSTDFMQVRKHYLGLYTLTGASLKAADVNGDGKINSTDFMQIRKHYLGLYEIKVEGDIIFGQPASTPDVSENESTETPAPSSEVESTETPSPSSTVTSVYSITIGPGEDESGWGPIF